MRQVQRQTGFADASRPDERHQPNCPIAEPLAQEAACRPRARRAASSGSGGGSALPRAGGDERTTARRDQIASRVAPVRSSAAHSARTVSSCGRRRSPRSRALTAWTDRPAMVASSSWVKPAVTPQYLQVRPKRSGAPVFMSRSCYSASCVPRMSSVRASWVGPAVARRPHSTDGDRDHIRIDGAPPVELRDVVVLPHLDAAFRLARSLTESDQDAEDIAQEAALRAFRYFRTFSGGNGRAWFLRIVRHICYDCYGHKRNRTEEAFDEDAHTASPLTPEMLLLHEDNVSLIEDAMRDLPERFRELLVLRELEGCSAPGIGRPAADPDWKRDVRAVACAPGLSSCTRRRVASTRAPSVKSSFRLRSGLRCHIVCPRITAQPEPRVTSFCTEERMSSNVSGRRDFLAKMTALAASLPAFAAASLPRLADAAAADATITYDPAAKFEITVSEVELRRNTAGRMLMARIYQPNGCGTVSDRARSAWRRVERQGPPR